VAPTDKRIMVDAFKLIPPLFLFYSIHVLDDFIGIRALPKDTDFGLPRL